MNSKDANENFIKKGHIFGVVWPHLTTPGGLYGAKRAILGFLPQMDCNFHQGAHMDSKEAKKLRS